MRTRRRTSKARRWIEALLLLAGVIAVGIWAWSYLRMAAFQSWGNRVLDHRIDGGSATVSRPRGTPPEQTPPSVKNGALIGRLAIPRLFAALFLLSVTGIVIYLVLDFISRRLLRNWHESATTEEE